MSRRKDDSKPRYEKLGKLGSGSFGDVYKGRNRDTGALVALKSIKDESRDVIEDLERYGIFSIRKAGPHPNIVTFLDEYDDPSSRDPVFVFEYLEGGDLYSRLRKLGSFSEADSGDVIAGALKGLLHLHKHGIIHRDVKPENILVRAKAPPLSVALSDFGFSSLLETRTKMEPFVGGTFSYCPPEAFEQYLVGRTSDTWAVGIILVELLLGHHPMKPISTKQKSTGFDNTEDAGEKIKAFKWNFNDPEYKYIPSKARDLADKLLKKDFRARLNAHDALQHTWFKSASKHLIFSAETLDRYPCPKPKAPWRIDPEPEVAVEDARKKLSNVNLNDKRKASKVETTGKASKGNGNTRK